MGSEPNSLIDPTSSTNAVRGVVQTDSAPVTALRTALGIHANEAVTVLTGLRAAGFDIRATPAPTPDPALRETLEWLRHIALNWAVFKQVAAVYHSNEMNDIRQRIDEALRATPAPTGGLLDPWGINGASIELRSSRALDAGGQVDVERLALATAAVSGAMTMDWHREWAAKVAAAYDAAARLSGDTTSNTGSVRMPTVGRLAGPNDHAH